jgi:hypothetical protein
VRQGRDLIQRPWCHRALVGTWHIACQQSGLLQLANVGNHLADLSRIERSVKGGHGRAGNAIADPGAEIRIGMEQGMARGQVGGFDGEIRAAGAIARAACAMTDSTVLGEEGLTLRDLHRVERSQRRSRTGRDNGAWRELHLKQHEQASGDRHHSEAAGLSAKSGSAAHNGKGDPDHSPEQERERGKASGAEPWRRRW